MKTRKVIKSRNLHAKSPIWTMALTYLLLDKWNASEWIWGALGGLFLIWFIIWIVDLFNTEDIDIFNDSEKEQKKTFHERLKEVQEKRKKDE